MPTKVSVTCENGHQCTITIEELNLTSLNVKGVINTDQKCPICKTTLTGPSGKYVKDEDDQLVRVGDYEEDTIH